MQDDQRFTKGLEIRRDVLGDEYVDRNLSGSDEFMMTFQRIVTELAWGYAWNGTSLDRKTKPDSDIATPVDVPFAHRKLTYDPFWTWATCKSPLQRQCRH